MWLALSLSGFVLAVLLHPIFARMGSSLTIIWSFLCVSMPIAVLLASAAVWLFAISDESIAAVLVYLALCEAYIFLFAFAATAVSVSLLMRLRTGPMAVDALLQSFSTRAMVERRIEQLQAGGLLLESGGQIRLLERGEFLVRAFGFARGLFKHHRPPDAGAA